MGGGAIGDFRVAEKPMSPFVATSHADFANACLAYHEARGLTGTPYVVLAASAKDTPETFADSVAQKTHIYGQYGLEVRVLHTFEAKIDLDAAQELIDGAAGMDMPGGSTDRAFAYWVKTGLLQPIVFAIAAGLPVYGDSAGMIIWAAQALTDSESYGLEKGVPWLYQMRTYTGTFDLAMCPHAADNARKFTYNEKDYGPDTTRRDVFEEKLVGSGLPGLAIDGNTWVVITGPTATVYGDGVVSVYTLNPDGSHTRNDLTAGQSFNISELCATAS